MNAVDTNVLLYLVDADEAQKQAKSHALMAALVTQGTGAILLWQVAVELAAGLWRWQHAGKVAPRERIGHWRRVESTFSLVLPRSNLVPAAFDLLDRHSLSYWDALLVAACIEAGVDTLYSEDFSGGATYDSVEVINPFT
jgi:predicted nucleic acid-binding protein